MSLVIKNSEGNIAKDIEEINFYRAGSKALTYHVENFSGVTAVSDNNDILCGVDSFVESDSTLVNVYVTCTAESAEGYVTLKFTGSDSQIKNIRLHVKKFEDFGFISADDKGKLDFLYARGLILGVVQDNYDDGLWIAWEVPDADVLINKKE